MSTFDWQEQLKKRRRRTKYERIGTMCLLVFILGFSLWRVFYANTPEYMLEKLSMAIDDRDTETIQKYCNLDSITAQAYDDLTRDMFAVDDTLSNETKVMFEQFYVKIKPQVLTNTMPLLLSYISTGTWTPPSGDNILKGRQLGIDYEYLIERSQLRNTELVRLESVERTDDKAEAKIQIKDLYTGTTFMLNLSMIKNEDGWQITKMLNYRDFLDFVKPIQNSGLTAYVKATKDVIDKYNNIIDTQQTNFGRMTTTNNGVLTGDQKNRLISYINSDIIPALEKRQQELEAVPLTDGAQYLKKLRTEETQRSVEQWQHFATGIQNDDVTELNMAKSLQADALEIQYRIDDVLKNTAVNKTYRSIP